MHTGERPHKCLVRPFSPPAGVQASEDGVPDLWEGGPVTSISNPPEQAETGQEARVGAGKEVEEDEKTPLSLEGPGSDIGGHSWGLERGTVCAGA